MKLAVTAIFAFSVGVAITVGVATGITGWVQAGEPPPAVLAVELERTLRLELTGLEGGTKPESMVCKKVQRKRK